MARAEVLEDIDAPASVRDFDVAGGTYLLYSREPVVFNTASGKKPKDTFGDFLAKVVARWNKAHSSEVHVSDAVGRRNEINGGIDVWINRRQITVTPTQAFQFVEGEPEAVHAVIARTHAAVKNFRKAALKRPSGK